MLLSNPAEWEESGYDECENGQPLNPKLPAMPCLDVNGQPTNIRCKVYTYAYSFKEGHFWIDVGLAMKMRIRWNVCYRPNGGGITRIKSRTSTYDAMGHNALGHWRVHGARAGVSVALRPRPLGELLVQG